MRAAVVVLSIFLVTGCATHTTQTNAPTSFVGKMDNTATKMANQCIMDFRQYYKTHIEKFEQLKNELDASEDWIEEKTNDICRCAARKSVYGLSKDNMHQLRDQYQTQGEKAVKPLWDKSVGECASLVTANIQIEKAATKLHNNCMMNMRTYIIKNSEQFEQIKKKYGASKDWFEDKANDLCTCTARKSVYGLSKEEIQRYSDQYAIQGEKEANDLWDKNAKECAWLLANMQ